MNWPTFTDVATSLDNNPIRGYLDIRDDHDDLLEVGCGVGDSDSVARTGRPARSGA